MSFSPRFLITRLSHIGDCVLTVPLVQQLKYFWPDCRIAWAMESPSHKLLAHLPELDQVFQVPRGYLKKPSAIRKLRAELQAWQPDLVLDPQSLTKSAFLGWLSGARQRLGLGGSYQKELSRWFHTASVAIPPSTTHLVDRTLCLLPAIVDHLEAANHHLNDRERFQRPIASLAIQAGVDPRPNPKGRTVALDLPIPDQDGRWASDYLAANWGTTAPVLINPGASWPSKRWENERFAQVAAHIYREFDRPSVVTWAGAEEEQWARQIVDQSDGAARLAPETTLTQFCALAQKSTMFLGCDTGPMHMAAAVGTPCVVLFGPTRPQDSGPYGFQHTALQVQYQGGGARERRRADNHAMREIQVGQVFEACGRSLLHSQRSRHAG